jgi:hypothetical protein
MRRFVTTFIILFPLGVSAARADFVVTGSPPPSPSTPGSPAGPRPGAQGEPVKQDGDVATNTPDDEGPRFKIARGFGTQVALSFAVRQIVPHAVKVTYGPGASPDAIVSWKGGDGWNRVLLRAVHPLGLRLVMTTMAVQIRK